MADWSHTKSWSDDPRAVAGARRFVQGCLTSHDRYGLVDDVSLVVSELATNAVLHASTTFSVTLAGHPDSLLLTVRDDSRAQPTVRRRGLFALGGRGLVLVEAHSTAWGFSSGAAGGKSVWASFDGGAQTSTSRADGEGVGETAR